MKFMPLLAAALLAISAHASERLLTTLPRGHQIHHRQAFSPDGRHIYYDSRNDETQLAASSFIGRVEIATGREEILYRLPDPSSYGPGVGAVTCNPVTGRLAFIHGLDKATAAEPYAAHRRSGAYLTAFGELIRLDARDVTPPSNSISPSRTPPPVRRTNPHRRTATRHLNPPTAPHGALSDTAWMPTAAPPVLMVTSRFPRHGTFATSRSNVSRFPAAASSRSATSAFSGRVMGRRPSRSRHPA